jgi:ATP-dependent Lon protease
LTDVVVLPNMVVPVALDDAERQAAVDAAKAASDDRLLVVSRLGGQYVDVGVVATIDELGKLPGGQSAVVLRATQRARVGSGVSGPGSALWVEAEILEETPASEGTNELAAERTR